MDLELLRARAVFDPGAYRVPIEHLVDRTGLDFEYLEEFEQPRTAAGLRSGTARLPIMEDYTIARFGEAPGQNVLR